MTQTAKLTAKDFTSDQDVKWCPGCGDYAILKQIQTILPETGLKKEDIVFVSGIGCSSRFPYYMDTYGMHSIHGRGASVATGLKLTNPDLSVWLVTGDGDALSIGGNHLIHTLRRNPNLNILLFNNEIYGLTKGQYSPTSSVGSITKSSPKGSVDQPLNPITLALGSDSTFIARTSDRDPRHMKSIFLEAEKHQGTSFVEIYQNCIIFNDKTFGLFTEKSTKADHSVYLEEGEPLIFGTEKDKVVTISQDLQAVVKNLDQCQDHEIWIHDSSNKTKAYLLGQMVDSEVLPRPFGIFYKENRVCYEELVNDQVEDTGDLDALLRGKSTWEI